MKPRVFSGIRSSGKLHLGNYLGAIKNWIELQDTTEQPVFAVVDLHGITTPYDPDTYQEQVQDVVLDFLAAGVDPAKALLIRQSKVPQHTELMWLFGTITPVGWLERLPTYKEKLTQVKESGGERAKSYQNNFGLLAYPVLMAADILLYKANLVPVGEDQLKHLDLANEIGAKFNHLFGETFEPVKPHLTAGAKIMSLQNPERKMSKTGDEGIALSDDADTVRDRIKRAVTDSGKEIKYDPEKKPAISNLLNIYSLLGGKSIKDLEAQYESAASYAKFKEDLAEVVVDFLKPFQTRYKELNADPDYVAGVLAKSEEEAKIIASSNLKEFKQKMGLE